MSSAWSSLPNADRIDWVIADLKKQPDAWDAVRDAARGAAWDAARDAARDAVRDAARDAAWNTAWDAALDAVWNAALNAALGAAWGAVLALIAWDDCSELLDSDPDQVLTLALLGNHSAVLLLPAVRVLHQKEPVHV